ncbi:PfkB family carbohydrate kinase [Inmirania thermothiophila]|uniref:Ketohexokinase n=1 Tax=Inmirania thermothiophila TaxID=1750597 RepID=A0A3N1Y712_9GAMM|nr:PfkB family carbohydrate kinase [Inmirania thermothiophila]ROR34614.1 ketohexokinase [Inmirania thermothiophila]
MARGPILVVGNVVVDLVLEVAPLPRPDEEVRADGAWLDVGGNGANVARVLAALGREVALAAVLPGPPWEGLVRGALAGVELAHALAAPGQALSAVLLDRGAGTRTIVHHRALPEYPAEALAALAGPRWGWAHIEARDGRIQAGLVAGLREAGVAVSVEVEKERPGLEALLAEAAVAVFSRPFAEGRGARGPEDAAARLAGLAPGAVVVATWGAEGCAVRLADGRVVRVAGEPVAGPADTLGAGDVFQAGLVAALARGADAVTAAREGAALAARRCRTRGLGRFVAALRAR